MEVEKPSSLILPNGSIAIRADNDLVAGAVQGFDQVHGLGIMMIGQLSAVPVTHEAVTVLKGPPLTRHLMALIGATLDSNVVSDAAHLAFGGAGVSSASDRPGIGSYLPVVFGYQHVGITDRQVAPLH